jgi:hypothetical protein
LRCAVDPNSPTQQAVAAAQTPGPDGKPDPCAPLRQAVAKARQDVARAEARAADSQARGQAELAEADAELKRTGDYDARDKHELHQGHLVTMQGASMKHNTIVANLLGGIVPHLRGKSCRAFPSDLRVYIPTAESFTYPDISIVCDDPDTLDDSYPDTIKNPSVIIEVLSPSTEKYDRGLQQLPHPG